MVWLRRDIYEAFEVLDSKVDYLEGKLKEYEDAEEKIGRTVEEKVFEIKAVSYVTLIIAAVQLALILGAVVKLVLG
ncbi:MAG: hypothetical protein NTY90_04370 [Candidatus Micrarchaeota archaeon]|nr:hypothetical protein [Candidatus Micrarchaeota archaeon]